MSLFQRASNQQAYLKCGIFGFAGSGKTYTATTIALGLHAHIKSEKPVGFLDTETGSDYMLPRFDTAGIKLDIAKSRAFKDLVTSIDESEKAHDILIIDSLSHFWAELCTAYIRTKKDGTRFIRLQDWGPLKNQWAAFSERYVASKLHIIWCARAANVFEDVEDTDATTQSGRNQFKAVKVGTKARSESESSYEPSLLLEMEKIFVPHDGKAKGRYVHRCNVIKDRWDVIDSQDFDDPTFKNFLPHISLLNLGGEHMAVDLTRSSDSLLLDDDKSVARMRRRREILLEEIEGELTSAFPGGNTAKDRKARADLAQAIFDTRSWEKMKDLKPSVLEEGLTILKGVCGAIKRGEEVLDYESAVKEYRRMAEVAEVEYAGKEEAAPANEQPALI